MTDDVDVSILICVHNQAKLTRECLESLWPTLPAGLRVEVLVYDDHSSDETATLLESISDRVRTIRDAQRGWFGRNMNRLAAEARGRWICLLNNDVLLHPRWLEAMVELAEKTPNAGVIGNFHRFPQTGRINHAGFVFDQERTPRHLYLGMPSDLPAARKTRRFQCVGGACWLVNRELFLKLGGFDLDYRNGCEDLDFCFRIREAGYEVWYCGDSRIDHYGQSTAGRMDSEEANHRRFFGRWKNAIAADLQSVAAIDGVDWPAQSWHYRAAYRIWRSGPMRTARERILRTRWGMRLRQRVIGLLQAS